MKTIRGLVAKWFGYHVQATWLEDGTAHRHYALTRREALEWMACYPRECAVRIYRKRVCVMARG